LWCGWAVSGTSHRAFFAGDTGYHPEFEHIARRWGPFDLVMLPIGAYEPRWFMQPVHMNPEDAMLSYHDLAAGAPAGARPPMMLPIHWGTFRLTDEAMEEPPIRTRQRWREAALDPEGLWLLAHGETRRIVERAAANR
jgi:L-ascorbate metabolism protein UlaG (beta-lactamase superfamily)